MSAGIDRTPDEIFLQIFDAFTFNELRPILRTSLRWRSLAQASPAFWRDILTPRSNTSPNLDAAICVACTRIACTSGRPFALRLHGAFPDILSATTRHLDHVEQLDVQLAHFEEVMAVIWSLNTGPAPLLRTFAIGMNTKDDRPWQNRAACVEPPVLRPSIFSGAHCPLLTRLWLSNVALPPSTILQCFANVTELRVWQIADLSSAVTPDIFLHFPTLRRLGLRTTSESLDSDFGADEREIIRKFRTADYSRLEYIELLDDCVYLPDGTAWPVDAVAHVQTDNWEYTSFPFLPPLPFSRGHIVFEPHGEEDGCIIRLGNDGWTFSRTCVSDPWAGNPESRGTDPAVHFDFSLGGSVAEAVRTATVPADLLSVARFVIADARSLETLRIVTGPRSELPNVNGLYRLYFPNLRALALHGDFDPSLVSTRVTSRITYDALVHFAATGFDPHVFPISLLLEDVELCGEQPDAFTTYFCDVQAQDPASWSYLPTRRMLNRDDGWFAPPFPHSLS